jgi:flagellar protein FlgJ
MSVTNIGTVSTNAVGASSAETPQEAKLRRTAHQLEGVFVQQLFKAMRDTVPQDGIAQRGQGEEMWSSMLDQHVAETAPEKWHSSLGEALFRQLRAALPAEQKSATDAATAATQKGQTPETPMNPAEGTR